MYVISSVSGGRRGRPCDPRCLGESFKSFPPFITTYAVRNSASETPAGFACANIDWKETPEAHVFKADLPGLKKEQVKVEVEEEGKVLKISGERSKEAEEENDKYHHLERSSGKFLRRFRLPEDVNMDAIQANMENGVLTVTLPKKEQKKPQLIRVEISG